MTGRSIWCALLGFLLSALPAGAQERPRRFAESEQQEQNRPSSLRPIRVAKWSALSVAAGFAAYGFARSGAADDAFRDLERACNLERERCLARKADGAYADAALENRYQDVLDLDQKVRTALILSQVGLATSVVLFLLDLRNHRQPPDIPYVPRSLTFDDNCAAGWICMELAVGR
jgi:hypothetical protein